MSTSSGNLNSKIFENKEVETEIGLPKLKWNQIPLSKNINTKNLNLRLVDKENKEFFGRIAVNVGNPHIIFFL